MLSQQYQRSEKALVFALMQMVVQGIPPHRVKKITTKLCGRSFSKSAVSRLTKKLDESVGAWTDRTSNVFRSPLLHIRLSLFRLLHVCTSLVYLCTPDVHTECVNAMDALVIALVNPKGGTGKTTIAIHTAVAAHREGYHTMLVDTDPQGSVQDWHRLAASEDRYEEIPVVSATDPGTLQRDIEQSIEQSVHKESIQDVSPEVVVVDGAARLEGMTGAVLSVADLALIPVQPSGLDLWGTMEAAELVGDHVQQGLRAAYVASRRDVRTSLSQEVLDVLRSNEADAPGADPLDVLEGTTHRVSYARALSQGRTVFDTSDTTAQNEVRALMADVARLLS